MQLLIKNSDVFIDGKWTKSDLLIENEKIAEIASEISMEGAEVIDASGLKTVPGFVDVHVHLREPGGEQKETIKTGTQAAARGGFTTIAAMPNTNPVPDSPEVLETLNRKIQKDAEVRVLPYASITKNLMGEALSDFKGLAEAGAFAFTDDGVGIQTSGQMLEAMKMARALDIPVVAHCEDNSLINDGCMHEGEVSERFGLKGIPSVCEAVQIARDVLLAEASGVHYHVCHVSTKESVRVIRDAKRAGIRVTAEVTPHHLLLSDMDIPEPDTRYKMNPPLRSHEDREALIEGLIDGTIDCIATDHAPHTAEDKAKGMEDAPFGITGLETAFTLLYTHLVQKGVLSLETLIEKLTLAPALAFSLPFGKIAEGGPADLTLLDLNLEEKIDAANSLSKGRNTPFDGWHSTGYPVLTISQGRISYQKGRTMA